MNTIRDEFVRRYGDAPTGIFSSYEEWKAAFLMFRFGWEAAIESEERTQIDTDAMEKLAERLVMGNHIERLTKMGLVSGYCPGCGSNQTIEYRGCRHRVHRSMCPSLKQ